MTTRAWRTPVMSVVLIAVAAAGGFWAGRTAIPPEPAPSVIPAVWGKASAASVGRSIPVAVTVTRPTTLAAQNALSGVVTSTSAGRKQQGDTVYVVGQTPVRVVVGNAPMWRPLKEGDKGDDVRSVQQALVHLKLLDEAPGVWGVATTTAVKEWQKKIGAPVTGSIAPGEVVTVKSLPGIITLGEAIAPGRTLAGGEDAVFASGDELAFVASVQAEQAQMIPRDGRFEIMFTNRQWAAKVSRSTPNRNGGNDLVLIGTDGGAPCARECHLLPPEQKQTLLARAVITPERKGIAVPSAAIRTRPDQSTYVVTRSGNVAVTVVASSQGLTIVEGLREGTEVELAGAASAPPQTGQPTPGR